MKRNMIIRTEIPLKKTRLTLMLLVCIPLAVVGFWLLLNQHGEDTGLTFLRFIGVAGALFFGYMASIISRKLRDNTPGLIIDEIGIIDNSSTVEAGLIPWRDIKNVSVVETEDQKMIMLEVYDPAKYIDRQNHYLQKKAMQNNLKLYGSPVSITVTGLKCTFDKLYTLIKVNLEDKMA